MAALSTTLPTLLDLSKQLKPDGMSLDEIVPILVQDNEILPRLRWLTTNGLYSHRSTYQAKIPRPVWTGANTDVAPTKGTTGQSVDGLGEMQGYSMVDPIIADPVGAAAFRMNQDRMHLQGGGEEFCETFFYGNADLAINEFTGLAPRYAAGGTSPLKTETGENVITGAGSGSDNMSMWLLTLDGEFPGVVGLYRQGTVAGFQMKNLGLQTIPGSTAGTFGQRYVTHYRWSCGITVTDWRKNVRICNVDKSALTKDISAGADLHDLVAQAAERLPTGTRNSVLCVNRTAMEYFRRQAIHKVGNSTLDFDSVAGRRVLRVGDFEVLRCDSLNADEAAVPMA